MKRSEVKEKVKKVFEDLPNWEYLPAKYVHFKLNYEVYAKSETITEEDVSDILMDDCFIKDTSDKARGYKLIT